MVTRKQTGDRGTMGSTRATIKYKKYSTTLDPTEGVKKRPSQLVHEMYHPPTHTEGWRPTPHIVEYLNMADFTHQTECAVDVDEPIFQPFPPEIVFSDYLEFEKYELLLCLRNNDKVARRVKVVKPSSAFFSVERMLGSSEKDKVAPGMEVQFKVKFCPNSRGDFKYDLVVCTEREKFLVPLIASGERAVLNFPDHLDFGSNPTRSKTKRSFIVSNVGAKPTSFLLNTAGEFSVVPRQGELGPGETLQCSVEFQPTRQGPAVGEMEVVYESGATATTTLYGEGHEIDVSLDMEAVAMLPTFVTRSSQKNFYLFNSSDRAVKFSWKSAGLNTDDFSSTAKRMHSLGRSLREELVGEGGEEGEGAEDELSDDSADEDMMLTRRSTMVQRKYKRMYKDVDLDRQLFADDYYAITPLEGVVPAHGQVQFTVRFSPDHQRQFTATAYCEVEGREARLPIALSGVGCGPNVIFSYDVLDVGDTFVNTLHQYEVQLQNRGEIEAPYQLLRMDSSPFSSKFSFEPDAGVLAPGQSEQIRVKLLSNILGPFDEVFCWNIKGCSDDLTLQFRGRVAGPEFEIDPPKLDFGLVSYGFRYTTEFNINNVSEIPFDFKLRVPRDNENAPEFQVIPETGRIAPFGQAKVVLEICSETVMKYSGFQLVVDVPDVGEEMGAVDILAECCVPKLSLSNTSIDFGNCYLRYPYKALLKLVNESKLPARFEVLPQDSKSSVLGTYTAEPREAGIPAKGEQLVEFVLDVERLGRIQLPVTIKVAGSRSPPLQCTLDCFAMGPSLQFQVMGVMPELADEAAITWGKVPVLAEHEYTLHMYNPTLISADVKAFIEGKASMFAVDTPELRLEPGGTADIRVACNLDEVQPFKDVLHMMVTDGADNCIPLSAVGIGNTVVCEELPALIDLGNQFTNRAFTREYVLRNEGRKSHTLVWSNTVYEEEALRKADHVKETKKARGDRVAPFVPREVVWKVEPERLIIPGKSQASVTVTGFCTAAGEVSETLVCASVPSSGKGGKTVFECNFKASVEQPLLTFSKEAVRFEYWYEASMGAEIQIQELGITNSTLLPLTFTLSCSAPFAIDLPSWSLDPGEDCTVAVSFDPMYKGDLVSHEPRSKINVRYSDNPQRDSLEISADINFPNIQQSLTAINFGNCLYDTRKRAHMSITNTSKVPAVFQWVLIDPAVEEVAEDMGSDDVASVVSSVPKKSKLPANQVFDVLPIRGVLPPGEQVQVEFSYFAYPGAKAECEVVLEVEGGPYGGVSLAGESNTIQYSLEPQVLDLGHQLYDRTVEREVVMINQGKVNIEYDVNLLSLSRPGTVVVLPSSGKGLPGLLPAGQKETFRVRCRPGIPDVLNETVLFEIGPFEPVPLKVMMEGVYPGLYLTVPRRPTDEAAFTEAMEAAQHTITIDGPKLGISSMAPDRRARSVAPSRALERPGSGKSRSGADDAKSLSGTAVGSVAGAAGDGKSVAGMTVATMNGPTNAIDVEIETEAERLMMCAWLLEREAGEFTDILALPPTEAELEQEAKRQASTGGAGISAESTVSAAPVDASNLLDFTTREGRVLLHRRLMRPNLVRKSFPVTLAEYCLDLGFLVKGTKKVRKFRLQNTSFQNVSFNLNKKALEAVGVKVEPDAIGKLPGAPDFPSVPVQVTFDTTAKGISMGPMRIDVPIAIKGGPTVRMAVMANIMMPVLEVSRTELDFGKVQTGCCRIITVQFSNPGKVAAEWSLKKPMEATKNKDWSHFVAEPSEGVIPAGGRANVRFIHTPVKGRVSPYAQVIPVKVTHNPKPINFRATAQGYGLKLNFDPPIVDCGAILPAFEGQPPNERVLRLVNPGDEPIEVYNLDFDEHYADMEAALRDFPDYPEGADTVLVDPLPAGAPFYPHILRAAALKREMDVAAAEAAAEAEAAAAEAAEAAAEAGEQPPPEAAPAEPGVEEVGELEATVAVEGEEAVEVEDSSVNILLIGPPTSGVSCQASAMGSRYGVPVVTVDELIHAGIALAESEEEREELTKMLPPDPSAAPPVEEVPPPPDPKEAKKGGKGKKEDKKGGKGGAAEPVVEVPQGMLDPTAGLALLAATLPRALGNEAYLKGVVVDGAARSSLIYGGAPVTEGLLRAFGLTRVNAAGPMDVAPTTGDEKGGKGKKDDKKGGKGGKGGDAEVAEPFWWEGKKKVHVLELAFGDEDILARYKASLPPAPIEEAAPPPPASPLAEDLAAELDEAAAMEVGGEGKTDGGEEEEEQPPPESLKSLGAAELAERVVQWHKASESLAAVFGAQVGRYPVGPLAADGEAPPPPSPEIVAAVDAAAARNCCRRREVPAGGERDPTVVTHACAGIHWVHGVFVCELPSVEEDKYIVPSDYTLRILKKPGERPSRAPITHFKILTPVVQPELEEGELVSFAVEEEPQPEDPKEKKAKEKTKPKKGEVVEEVKPEDVRVVQNRWVVPAGKAVHLVVQFSSPDIGRYNQLAGFEVVGDPRSHPISLSGICVYPTISTDYRNVYFRKVKTRPQSPLVNRQYIINKQAFEFGPLLAKKPSEGWREGEHPDNCSRMRITNNGHFDLHVEFKLKSSMPPEEGEGGGGKKDAKKASKDTIDNTSIFLLDPPEMDIPVDETQELFIYAFPNQNGLVEDAVMAVITDNPDPAEFPLSCVGDTPRVDVSLESDEKGVCKGLTFERLLLDKTDSQTFAITNTCLLPVAWILAGCDALPKEVTISPESGVLAARSTVEVTVELHAIEKKIINERVTLQIRDVKEVLPVAQEVPIPIVGEAYKIEVDVKFPEEGVTGIDFGTVKVVDDHVKTITIQNTGKYTIGYKFNVRRAWVAELFEISPAEGQIEPGGKTPTVISFHFNKDHALQTEVSLVGANDVTMSVIEVMTDATEEVVPIKVSLQALWNKYSLTPARGIHFGPHVYNTVSNPRTFTLSNLGEFDFNFTLFRYADGWEAAGGSADEGKKKGDKKGDKKGEKTGGKGGDKGGGGGVGGVVASGELEIGAFKFTPALGTVPPGHSVDIAVEFRAEGAATFVETLGLDVTDRDAADQPKGIPYEVAGESCIPGIVTEDTVSMFEEHNIANVLDPFLPVNFQFAMRDKVFNFGAVIADLSASDSAASAGDAEEGGPPEGGAGVRANIKISNPIKVPCTVNFSIRPRGTAATTGGGGKGGGKGDKGGKGGGKGGGGNKGPSIDADGFPMEVHPKKLDIPPHEYRYVTVYFSPKAIKSFVATFEAIVENGGNPKTERFECEVRGEGTLPTLTLEQPALRDNKGQPWLKFPRVLKGKKHTATMLLKNNGIIVASGRLDFTSHKAFRVDGGSRVFTLEPHKAEAFTVVYHPREVGEAEHSIRLKVQQNPFENYQVRLSGEAYMEDVVYEGLPGDAEDELRFSDGPLGVPRSVAFTLRNLSDKHYHFEWPAELEGISISPQFGHLHAGASKDMVVTFHTDDAVAHDAAEFPVDVTPITYPGDPVDWDDRQMVMVMPGDAPPPPPVSRAIGGGVKGGKDKGGKAGKEKGGKGDKEKATKKGGKGVKESPRSADDGEPTAAIAPEPECEADGAASKAIPLRLFAVADMAKPECDDSAINFRPTMMFQTRAFTFPLRNTSTAQMDFKWAVCTLDGEPEADSIYEVRPEGGVVEAGGSVDVTVRFKPVEVVDARRLLIASIPHMPEGAQALSRPLNGRILRPWCHFEMPESDYLSSGRRNPDMKGPEGDLGPLDPATRVVEYESLGTKVRNTKRFFVLNPTSMSYEFFWGPQKVEGGKAAPVGPFRCLTPRGVCQSGKRYEMAFEYTPEDDEVTEGFWEFRIPDQGITVPFLMVGHVKEPRVALDRPGVHFGKVLVGTNITETMHLINSENIPFSFAFDKSTYEASRERIESTGAAPVVQFSPADGTVMANSSLPIQVSYRPALEKLTNYNVVMTVRKKPTRLALNVKGEGYLIHEVVTVDTSEGGAVELDPAVPNSVDFGQVIINQRVVKNVSIVNSGEISYDFEWRVGENPKVSIKPEVGTVPKGERVVCELVYHSHGTDVMDHYPVSLKILNGNKYALRLSGVAHRPKLNFSFVSHDFGPTFLAEPGLDPSQVVLLARNDDVQEVSFDCMFEGTDAFTLACSPTVLTPGESKTMAVQFHPSTAGKYAEVASFEVNGLYSINVSLTGEGVPMKVEVAPPSGPVCNFGSAKQGSAVSRTVHLRNASKVPARLSLAPMAEVLERYNVEAVPAGELLIKPRETAQLALYFRPQTRTRPFSEDFNVTVAGAARQLFRIQGACLGTELTFATDSIPFPPVVHGSRAVKRLQVENTGDVGTKFTWDTKKFGPNFSIFPAEGFLAPSQDTRLEVTFHPGRVDSDMRVERIRCKVEGGEDRFLTLTGSCVEQDGDATEVRFECAVRASVKQTVSIHNTSTTLAWQLQPVFRHDAWSGSEFLSVPPGKKADYTITFHPVSMSSAESPTEGSLFFPLPDGSGLLYKLVGVAGPPAPEGELALDVTAKSRFSGVLPVHNWLPQPQRFKVTIDKGGGDPATTLSGAEHIDVPNLSEREYRYAFYAFKEGVTEATVTFTNEVTGEYLFYKLAFKAGPPGLRGSLSLGCAVRQVTSQMIRLENPLETGVTMSGKSSDAQLSVPGSVEVPAGGSRTVEVSYRPLLVGERTASVAFECAELGLFQYEVALQGVPTGPETGLAFGVPLGSSEVQSFRFRHWLPDKADYACKFRNGGANGCFTVQSTAAAPPAEGAEGVEVEVSVTFEPTTISENFSDLLIVEHAAGGRYECPVKGRAEGPRPQGPVEIAGSSASVSHKNVFLQDATFHFSCDNPAFTVKPSELIKSKQSVNVNIAFKEQPGLPRTGKLTIACPDQTPSPWVYYLRA